MTENKTYQQHLDDAFSAIIENDPSKAIEYCETASEVEPERAEHVFLYGCAAVILQDLGRAIQLMEAAHNIEPEWRDIVSALCSLNSRVGNLQESLFYTKLEMVLEPSDMPQQWISSLLNALNSNINHINVSRHYVDASIAFHKRDFLKAVDHCEKELLLSPDNPDVLRLYGQVLMIQKEFGNAVEKFNCACELDSSNATGYALLAGSLSCLGLIEQSREAYQNALRLDPDSIEIRNQFITFLACHVEGEDKELTLQLDGLSDLLKQKADLKPYRSPKGIRTSKKIHIGFIINNDALEKFSSFIDVVFSSYNKSDFKFIGYQQYSQFNPITDKFKNLTNDWREIFEINDHTLAHIIDRDEISILIDLCGHSPEGRAQLLSGLSGVVRASWLNTPMIGLEQTCDVILGDETLKSAFGRSPVHSLAECSICYLTDNIELGSVLDVSPVQNNGFITFGAELDNHHLVFSAPLLAQVLVNIDDSQLILGAVGNVDDITKNAALRHFVDLGVIDRVKIQDACPITKTRAQFFASIDIYLDSVSGNSYGLVPDAMWSGVPAITLKGKSGEGSIVASMLRAAGRRQWISTNKIEFVDIAIELSRDVSGLNHLRKNLREEIRTSSLCDKDKFIDEFSLSLTMLDTESKQRYSGDVDVVLEDQ